MNDTIQRVKYFKNQFLRVEEFEAEQDYHRQMRRLHNSRLHEWGIARGLTVEVNSSEAAGVIITDGAAIDQDGYEIVLFHPLNKSLVKYQDSDDVYVTIAYHDDESATRVQQGLKDNNRWTETPIVASSEKEPEEPGKQMLLAKVILKNGRVENVDNSVRKLAGVISKELTARSIKFEVPGVRGDQWPQIKSGSDSQANPTGDLKLTADNLRVAASTQIDKKVQIGTNENEASLDVRGTLTVKKFIVDGFEEKCFSSDWFEVKKGGTWEIENPLNDIPTGFQMYCTPKFEKDKKDGFLLKEGDQIPVYPFSRKDGPGGYLIKITTKLFTIYTLTAEPIARFIKKDGKEIEDWRIYEGKYRFVFWKKKEVDNYNDEPLKGLEVLSKK